MLFIGIEQLLHKLFFLGHKENVGEKPMPPNSPGFSIVVFEFPSPSTRRQLMFIPTWNTPNIYCEWHARQLKLTSNRKTKRDLKPWTFKISCFFRK